MSDRAKSLTLTDENFQTEVIASTIPVLVDIWAAWCGPCRIVSPIIEEIAASFAKRAKVGKLNIDNYGEIASQYGVQAIPTLLFFKDGVVVDRVVGVASQKVLAEKLDALLENSASTQQAA